MLVAPSQRAEIVITTTGLQVRCASYTAPIVGHKKFIVKEAREYWCKIVELQPMTASCEVGIVMIS